MALCLLWRFRSLISMGKYCDMGEHFITLEDIYHIFEDELGKQSITYTIPRHEEFWLYAQLVQIEQTKALQRIAEALERLSRRI